jgi:hypothetical protein
VTNKVYSIREAESRPFRREIGAEVALPIGEQSVPCPLDRLKSAATSPWMRRAADWMGDDASR